MRPLLAAVAALVVAAPLAASAAPGVGDIRVSVGAPLAKKAKAYGQRELDWLTSELRSDVQKALSREGRLARAGLRLELTLVDAQPNRPTFAQMSHTPGLSMESISVGGARIEGVEIRPDGTRRPIRYRWYETSLDNEIGAMTWSDANRAFERFAEQYAKGKL